MAFPNSRNDGPFAFGGAGYQPYPPNSPFSQPKFEGSQTPEPPATEPIPPETPTAGASFTSTAVRDEPFTPLPNHHLREGTVNQDFDNDAAPKQNLGAITELTPKQTVINATGLNQGDDPDETEEEAEILKAIVKGYNCLKGHEHTWTSSGTLTIYSCERQCMFCLITHKFTDAAVLRNHVDKKHAKKMNGLTVIRSVGKTLTYKEPKVEKEMPAKPASPAGNRMTEQYANMLVTNQVIEEQNPNIPDEATIKYNLGVAERQHTAFVLSWLDFGVPYNRICEVLQRAIEEVKKLGTVDTERTGEDEPYDYQREIGDELSVRYGIPKRSNAGDVRRDDTPELPVPETPAHRYGTRLAKTPGTQRPDYKLKPVKPLPSKKRKFVEETEEEAPLTPLAFREFNDSLDLGSIVRTNGYIAQDEEMRDASPELDEPHGVKDDASELSDAMSDRCLELLGQHTAASSQSELGGGSVQQPVDEIHPKLTGGPVQRVAVQDQPELLEGPMKDQPALSEGGPVQHEDDSQPTPSAAIERSVVRSRESQAPNVIDMVDLTASDEDDDPPTARAVLSPVNSGWDWTRYNPV